MLPSRCLSGFKYSLLPTRPYVVHDLHSCTHVSTLCYTPTLPAPVSIPILVIQLSCQRVVQIQCVLWNSYLMRPAQASLASIDPSCSIHSQFPVATGLRCVCHINLVFAALANRHQSFMMWLTTTALLSYHLDPL